MTLIEEGVLRSVLGQSVLGAPPTIAELIHGYDRGKEGHAPRGAEIHEAADALVSAGHLTRVRGRYLPPSLQDELVPALRGEEWMPRKLRKARRVARWLVRVGGVRAVFLCNRTAFGLPRDEGDLDFLVIVRHGSIWQTRGISGLPFVLLGDRPGPNGNERDVVCLSFFLSDHALDLSPCALSAEDMYLRYWLLGLLPLADDGVGALFWEANAPLRARHPNAERWIPSPDLRITLPRLRIPVMPWFERVARSVQWKYFPRVLREKANTSTHVMISDERLKFHLDDGREALQSAYVALCEKYGIAP